MKKVCPERARNLGSSDLSTVPQAVSTSEGEALARKLDVSFYETSALASDNVEEVRGFAARSTHPLSLHNHPIFPLIVRHELLIDPVPPSPHPIGTCTAAAAESRPSPA